MSGLKTVRILFVCIGNSCRSPMAEAFANHLGGGWVEAASAGLFPAPIIQPQTIQVMAERGLPLDSRPPASILFVKWEPLDVVVNMTGQPLGGVMLRFKGRELAWPVPDPIGQRIEIYRIVRDQLEKRVSDLLEELRREQERQATG